MADIQIHALETGYAKNMPVLKDLTAHIPSGGITVLIGPNGSGKSTLLKAVTGQLALWGGSVTVDGLSIAALSRRERAQKIAYMAQQHNYSRLLLTLEELVLHGRFPYTSLLGNYSARDRSIAREAIEKLGLTAYAGRPLCALSGGQQQKAALAMALCQEAEVLVFDEPLTFLDIKQQLELLALLRTLCTESAKTVLLVVHDINMALTIADHLVVLSRGTVTAEGNAEDIVSSGVIDAVFGVRTEKHILAGHEKPYYTFERF